MDSSTNENMGTGNASEHGAAQSLLNDSSTNENMSTGNASEHGAAQSILNGVVGDYLDTTGNELTVEMAFYEDCRPLELSRLEQANTHYSNKICVLVHGLCDNESTWSYDNGDYGLFLQRDLDITPFYLRYNTGLHISTNGRKLSFLMNDLLKSYPAQVDEIVFLCHSMGGLVTRSACFYGAEQNMPWVHKVGRVVFLGTPHQGSYWEKAGNIVSAALGSIPRPYMRLAADVANLRSAGIKDLRFGYVQDEDWQGQDPDLLLTNTKKHAALLDWATYYVVTGTLTKNPRHPVSWFLGDALVRKPSAQGYSDNEEHHLKFSSNDLHEFAGIDHVKLTQNSVIYEQIKEWMAKPWESQAPACDEDQDRVAVSSHKVERASHGTVPARAQTAGKWAHCRGVATLVQDAVGNGATAVEGVQMALTSETYSMLSRITPMAPAVKGIQGIHEAAVVSVYGMIRAINYGTCEIAKGVFQHIEDREPPAKEESSNGS